MIEIKNISKSFSKKRKVLDDVSMKMRPGSVTGIYGENGEGKSTLLRIVSQVYRQDAGELLHNDKKIVSQKKYLRKISFIDSQTRSMYERLTGRQNIDFFHALYGEKVDTKKINDLAEGLKIKDDLDKPVSTYSLGMKQKLKILISFSRDFDILLLDEFTDHLDDRTVEFLAKYVRDEVTAAGKVTLYASKKKDLLTPFTDSVFELKEGKLS
jgi:ABC-type multidrug transport system ATPase subunit